MSKVKIPSNGTTKRPSFQLYAGDWIRDPGMLNCSVAAEGVWIRLMCYMHDCIPYGHAMVNGKPMTDQRLCNILGRGLSQQEYKALLDELESELVFTRLADGTIISKRMIRDGQLAEARSKQQAANAQKRWNDVASKNDAIASDKHAIASKTACQSDAKSMPFRAEDEVAVEGAGEGEFGKGIYGYISTGKPFDSDSSLAVDAAIAGDDAAYLSAKEGF